MVGGTLRDIRAHVSGLAAPTGPYAVVCARTAREPVPLAGERFDSREDAERAADVADEYHSALRRYDPEAPRHHLVVRDAAGPPAPRSNADSDVRLRYVALCHDVSGAVFEALSETGFRTAESAAMETYLTLAEVVEDRDDFCLTMLWSAMNELDVRLDAADQRTVVDAAAGLLGGATPEGRTEPTVGSALERTLARLDEASFVDGYDVAACPGGDAWEATFADYALAERTGRLPTLPIAVDLVRRLPDRPVAFTEATPLADRRWRLRVETVDSEESSDRCGLVSLDATDEGRLNETDYRL
ncbi:DUF7551 domain-containing protein [Halogeometricum luteum]|uniref:Halobacterial output domain-containing protein n=1 Tax=Halogeometricum luteum TaxID=2950537 RepID=A0ABU2FXQ9_9EURY|nr:hypothetical protein [Halogeometricum sp. S3BR5-2]MDS0293320.1 hypothetical protein [Halogeometricum sp. S3BR5-2]